MQKRNVELPANTLANLEVVFKEVHNRKVEELSNPWTVNIEDDVNAPAYYTQNTIYIFSILFSVFFGSFMLASNCKDAGGKGWLVILTGFIYTSASWFAMDYFSGGMPLTYIINALGVLITYELFWKRNIKPDKKYRAKPIWKPLTIAAVIFVPLIFLLISQIS
ncbi:hypothetical protein [Pedobacter foliorum]|uniref:hypothetical protein n=1 Tax=Pedobacter foliorum TaxID=2739058 RepID=UPI00156513E6|nr:hypothetical protein [Pedobacter foliorum]NRF37234.1 hypothetical protein [Pedobacter foliorum]